MGNKRIKPKQMQQIIRGVKGLQTLQLVPYSSWRSTLRLTKRTSNMSLLLYHSGNNSFFLYFLLFFVHHFIPCIYTHWTWKRMSTLISVCAMTVDANDFQAHPSYEAEFNVCLSCCIHLYAWLWAIT